MQSMRDMLWSKGGPVTKCSQLHAKLIICMGCVADMNSFITTTVTKVRASLLTFHCTKHCFPNLFASEPLFSSKNNNGSSHLCSCKYRMSGWEVSRIKNLYLRTDL